ncbi:MAG: hypothetical protein IJ165_13620 [Proteobacteria bacterium]|nr:hypothetical protein [Pseudomonadota bacterium]
MRDHLALGMCAMSVIFCGCTLSDIDAASYECLDREGMVDDFRSLADDVTANKDLCPWDHKYCLSADEAIERKIVCSRCKAGYIWKNDECVKTCLLDETLCDAEQNCSQNGECVDSFNASCLGDPLFCGIDEECNDVGECVPIVSCIENPEVCGEYEECNSDGRCVPKNCNDYSAICKFNEACNKETGQCELLNCNDYPALCFPLEYCNAEGKCVPLSCIEHPGVCRDDQVCNSEGECIG